jgi:hypothetical protein
VRLDGVYPPIVKGEMDAAAWSCPLQGGERSSSPLGREIADPADPTLPPE